MVLRVHTSAILRLHKALSYIHIGSLLLKHYTRKSHTKAITKTGPRSPQYLLFNYLYSEVFKVKNKTYLLINALTYYIFITWRSLSLSLSLSLLDRL